MEKSVRLAAPVDTVWAALVEPELQRAWMDLWLESTWRPGEPVVQHVAMQGHAVEMVGTVRIFEPPHRLGWDYHSPIHRVADAPENRVVVALSVVEEDGGTRLTVRVTHPDVVAMAEHADFYWDVSLHRLARAIAADC